MRSFTLGLFSFGFFILLTVVFIFIEGYLLHKLNYGSMWQGIGKATILNLFSAVLGFFAGDHLVENGVFDGFILMFSPGALFFVLMRDRQFWDFIYSIPVFIWWVFIEGIVLGFLVRDRPLRVIWRTTLIINIASYGIVFVCSIWFSRVSWG